MAQKVPHHLLGYAPELGASLESDQSFLPLER